MKVLMPFNNVGEVKKLIEMGADEFYCGVPFLNKNRKFFYFNARVYSYANLKGFEELKEAVAIIADYNKKIYLCANRYPTMSDMQMLLDNIGAAIEIGIGGVIIADHTLIPYIKKMSTSCKIILSCLNPCFNTEALKFFKSLSVDRIILPRQLTLGEIALLSETAYHIKLELEVFLTNITCRNINGHCLMCKAWKNSIFDLLPRLVKTAFRESMKKKYTFNPFGVACRDTGTLEITAKEKNAYNIMLLKIFSLDKNILRYCALCSLYFLKKCNITSVKIVGRGFTRQKKIQDLSAVGMYLNAINDGIINDDNCLEIGKRIYKNIYNRECHIKECFHYEVYQRRNS
ncbi:MAG: U32 family peptidase [Candidatus Omnitrophica bacterium]|nr:U32 family peptidase [Candidatus Omnitrophota bacterium]